MVINGELLRFGSSLFGGVGELVLNRNTRQESGSPEHRSDCLTVPAQREAVAALPVGGSGGPLDLVRAVAGLAQAAGLAASRGEAAALAVFVHWVADPVDLWVVPDYIVLHVDQNDLEVFVSGIRVHPV